MQQTVGVMGPGVSATAEQLSLAYQIGREVAESNSVLISGGMQGTMAEACRGAKEAGGFVVGICPTRSALDMCPHIDVAIVTAMGGGRNYINILSSGRVIAIGATSSGTLSEIAYAIQLARPLLIAVGTSEMRAYIEQLKNAGPAVQFTDGIEGVRKFLA